MANREVSKDFSDSLNCGCDSVTEMFCESCTIDDNYSTAEEFCVDCVKYFCATCMRFHKRFLLNHVHQDQHSMPQDFCLEICEVHPKEIIKFFCEACSRFACSECRSNLHQNCKTVRHVPKLVQSIEKSSNFQSFKSKIDHSETELKRITESLIQAKYSDVEKCCNYAKTAIKIQREEMNKQFDGLEMNIQRSIEKIRTDDTKQLDDLTSQYNQLKSKCESLRRNVEIMLTTGQRSKLCITMKNSENVVDLFEKSIAEIENLSKVQNYIYNPNRYLQAVIEDCDRVGYLADSENLKSIKRNRQGMHYSRPKHGLFKNALQSCGKNETCDFLQDDMNVWRAEIINIAVIGCSGAGKSTFINSMCEFDPEDTAAAKVGLTKTTKNITPYSLRRNENVKLWDFPGFETMNVKKERYLDLFSLKKFDFLIVVTSTRLTETEIYLMKEIEHHGKFVYLLRSHFDCDVESCLLQNDFRNDDIVETLRTRVISSYTQVLRDLKSNGNVFLIDGCALNQYDYERFEKTIIADAAKISESKALEIIFALPITTKYAREVKTVRLEQQLTRKALHAALCLPLYIEVVRSLLKEKELYIRQFPNPITLGLSLNADISNVEVELSDLEERLYHSHVHSAVDKLFQHCDKTAQFLLPCFDIVQMYTLCRVWLQKNLERLLPSS
ncbi:uncharacterized protein LOC128554442 [Mercenaria mercenaria]|uniref:uncharacterized protein LOC128554442 n=1 Tax=Mercenaria mercenaria TaxID=6596 RepID=UPI00234F5F30|nr:uncharacterized protein LOC128554442 [Mercenaria mercenaria]